MKKLKLISILLILIMPIIFSGCLNNTKYNTPIILLKDNQTGTIDEYFYRGETESYYVANKHDSSGVFYVDAYYSKDRYIRIR